MEQQPPADTNTGITSDENAQPELTQASQSNIQHPQTTSPAVDTAFIRNSTTLSFPTLSPDGSIDDLSSTPCHPHLGTPPAALSSLARKAKMPHTSMSDSTSSLDEGQYDMMDDASDFSNDDRETASLASTERGDGGMTPEGSIIDLDDERDNMESSTTIQGSFETLSGPGPTRTESQTRVENALIDSYMTDDMETPRQSLLRGNGFEQSQLRQPGVDSHTTTLQQLGILHESPTHILLVSERGVNDTEVADVCQHLASCLTGKSGAESTPTAVRLPPPPSGIMQPSPLFVIARDAELVVEHCIHASDARFATPNKYPLCIRSGEEERTAVFDTENAGHTDMEAPDLVIYYLTPGHSYPTWFINVKHAMEGSKVASMTLGAPKFSFDDLTGPKRTLAYSSDLVLSTRQLSDGSNEDLRVDLEILLERKSKATSRNKRKTAFYCIDKRTKLHILRHGTSGIGIFLSFLAFLFGVFYLLNTFVPRVDPTTELAVRRAALSNALIEVTNSTDAMKTFDIAHLVPQNSTSTYDVLFQGASPNHIVLKIPRKTEARGFSTPTRWKVYRPAGGEVAYNLTKLIDGIYHISVAPQEAHGIICTEVATKNPNTQGKSCHNFGSRMLQRQTYEKASMELSKAVNKDVAVASRRVKSLKDKLGLELTAGAVATKNVTTQLAVYVARDLQIFAHTAVSVFGKISDEGQVAMERLNGRIRRDAHNGLAQAEIGLHKLQEKSLQVKSQFTKDLILTKNIAVVYLLEARQRALDFKKRLSDLKKDGNSTSATKELSLRVQNFFKPSEKGKRAVSLRDVATCLRAEDYRACRREQRQKAKAVSAYKPPSALAKLPERDILEKVAKEGAPHKPVKVKHVDMKSGSKGSEAKSKKGARKVGKKAR